MRIAVVGGIASGKDMIGEYLVSKYGFTRYAFADNVKHVAKVWFPKYYGSGESKPRALLQAVGTKFREIDSDVWINSMFDDIDSKAKIAERYNFTQENIVVTDCRMPNEYKALKEQGFKFIQIDVSDEMRMQRLRDRGDLFNESDLQHHTEQYYDAFECDYSLSNYGDKELAYASVDEIMELIMEKAN